MTTETTETTETIADRIAAWTDCDDCTLECDGDDNAICPANSDCVEILDWWNGLA